MHVTTLFFNNLLAFGEYGRQKRFVFNNLLASFVTFSFFAQEPPSANLWTAPLNPETRFPPALLRSRYPASDASPTTPAHTPLRQSILECAKPERLSSSVRSKGPAVGIAKRIGKTYFLPCFQPVCLWKSRRTVKAGLQGRRRGVGNSELQRRDANRTSLRSAALPVSRA
jgi:hypothetical protein